MIGELNSKYINKYNIEKVVQLFNDDPGINWRDITEELVFF